MVGKKLEPYGFKYLKTDEPCRIFIREVKGVGRVYDPDNDVAKQYINIQESRFDKELIVRFETDVINPLNRNPLEILSELSPKPGYDSWFPYEDEESYRKILSTLADIVIQYGIDFLDQMSVEETIIPTKKMADELYSHHEEHARLFAEKYHLNTMPQSESDIDQWFETIRKVIMDTADQPYEDVKDLLVEIAAFIGERACEMLEQEWEFPEYMKVPCTSGKNFSIIPLREAVYNWRECRQKNPEIMWFKNDIEALKKAFWQSKEGPEFVLTMDIIERLDLDRYERADRFREKHNLDDSIFDEEHIQTWVDAADKAFKSWKVHIYEDAVWDMLEIVAFFSVQLERYMGAHWEKTVRAGRDTYVMAGTQTKNENNSILLLLDLMDLACTNTSMGNIFLDSLQFLFDNRT